MKRKIVGFDRDENQDWRAELECGHYQHVRHDPPLRRRPWVLTEQGRSSMIGTELVCVLCAKPEQKFHGRGKIREGK